MPFYFGFLLIGGMLMLVAGHYLNYSGEDNEKKFHLLISFGWTIAFFTLISFNHICQTTFVRHLALSYKPEYDTAIATFSMVNPMSLCWANEIWGYGLNGERRYFDGVFTGKDGDPMFTILGKVYPYSGWFRILAGWGSIPINAIRYYIAGRDSDF